MISLRPCLHDHTQGPIVAPQECFMCASTKQQSPAVIMASSCKSHEGEAAHRGTR